MRPRSHSLDADLPYPPRPHAYWPWLLIWAGLFVCAVWGLPLLPLSQPAPPPVAPSSPTIQDGLRALCQAQLGLAPDALLTRPQQETVQICLETVTDLLPLLGIPRPR